MKYVRIPTVKSNTDIVRETYMDRNNNILVVSVCCKIFYGMLLRIKGKQLNSVALSLT